MLLKLIKEIAGDTSPKFKLQQRFANGNWEDLSPGTVSAKDAQAFLDQYEEGDFDVEERAISTDGKITLKRRPKAQPAGKDTLARNAPASVHKRNADFFNAYL